MSICAARKGLLAACCNVSTRFFTCVVFVTMLLFAAFSASFLIPQSAWASEASIPVAQKFEDENNNGESVTAHYTLERISEDAPMPVGSDGNFYSWEMNGVHYQLIPVELSNGGVFEYTLKCDSPDFDNWAFDNAARHLNIYAANTEDGGLDASVVIVMPDGTKVEVSEWAINDTRDGTMVNYPAGPTYVDTEGNDGSGTWLGLDMSKMGRDTVIPFTVYVGATAFVILLVLFVRHRGEKREEKKRRKREKARSEGLWV